MLGNLVGGFIVILVGVTLMPTIADQVYYAQNWNSTGEFGNSSITGATSTILGLTTLFYALAVGAAGISIAAQGLKAAGMLGV